MTAQSEISRSVSWGESPDPTYSNARRLDRPTYGPDVAAAAAALGFELQPWQQHVADLFGEMIEDEDTGLLRPAYSRLSLSVGRRAGKTKLVTQSQASQIKQRVATYPLNSSSSENEVEPLESH